MNFLKELERKAVEEAEIHKEVEMEKFLLLKKNITNYFKCTKQFKEQFVAGIEKLDITLVKRYSEDKPIKA